MTTTSRIVITLLSDFPIRPLQWLWPNYIPIGHLTLLEGYPGIGTSLLATHIAACVSRGQPLPDGSPCQQGNVIFIAPLDSGSDVLTPRVQTAGGDPTHVLPLNTIETCDTDQVTNATFDYRHFSLLHDLPLLEAAITQVHATLVVLDPISVLLAHTTVAQRVTILTNLNNLAYHTNCAILLLRPISHPSKAQLADPGYLSTTAARDILMAVSRSRLILLPDPTDSSHNTLLLHCTKHNLCARPPTLATCIDTNTHQHPTLLWLGDDEDPLEKQDAVTLSKERQQLLTTLRESDTPLDARTLARFCFQQYHSVRKTLQRMVHDGQLVSPARGLFTTPGHPCLLHFPDTTSTVPTVIIGSVMESTSDQSLASSVPTVATVPTTPMPPTDPHPHSFASSVSTVAKSHPHSPNVILSASAEALSEAKGKDLVPTAASVPYQPPNSIPETPTLPQEPSIEDLYPSACIRPPKEPEIYPGW